MSVGQKNIQALNTFYNQSEIPILNVPIEIEEPLLYSIISNTLWFALTNKTKNQGANKY